VLETQPLSNNPTRQRNATATADFLTMPTSFF